MTTELEKEFFKTFGIEPKIYETDGRDIDDNGDVCSWYIEEVYPEITDRKLLEMICIYNSFQNDEASLLIPFDINNVKDIALQVITKSIKDKSLNNYYCNDVEKLKTEIQQLFKEEE